MASPEHIRATIDRIDHGAAVLVFDDQLTLAQHAGQTLTLPKRLLPKGVKEGDVLVLQALTDSDATESREQVARKLLEDILNGK